VLLAERYPEGYPRVSSTYIDSDSDPALCRSAILHSETLSNRTENLIRVRLESLKLEALLDELNIEIPLPPIGSRLYPIFRYFAPESNKRERDDLTKQVNKKRMEYGISTSFNIRVISSDSLR
jgi:hypothetical protein